MHAFFAFPLTKKKPSNPDFTAGSQVVWSYIGPSFCLSVRLALLQFSLLESTESDSSLSPTSILVLQSDLLSRSGPLQRSSTLLGSKYSTPLVFALSQASPSPPLPLSLFEFWIRHLSEAAAALNDCVISKASTETISFIDPPCFEADCKRDKFTMQTRHVRRGRLRDGGQDRNHDLWQRRLWSVPATQASRRSVRDHPT